MVRRNFCRQRESTQCGVDLYIYKLTLNIDTRFRSLFPAVNSRYPLEKTLVRKQKAFDVFQERKFP